MYTSEDGIIKCTPEVSKTGDKDSSEISCLGPKTMPLRTQGTTGGGGDLRRQPAHLGHAEFQEHSTWHKKTSEPSLGEMMEFTDRRSSPWGSFQNSRFTILGSTS